MDNDQDALSAITRAFTDDEARTIVDRFVAANPRWDGAHADDILDALHQADEHLDQIEPFFEAHDDELPDVPGVGYAVLAVIRMGRELTVPAVVDLLARAGLTETMTVSDTSRIRWNDGPRGNILGQAGTFVPALFQIFKPDRDEEDWTLISQFPGAIGQQHRNRDLKVLKGKAEDWLREFVAALGASFPPAGHEPPPANCHACGAPLNPEAKGAEHDS